MTIAALKRCVAKLKTIKIDRATSTRHSVRVDVVFLKKGQLRSVSVSHSP